MRKTLFIALILTVLIFVTGCSGKTYEFKKPIDEIESVEIVLAKSSVEFTVTKALSEIEKDAFIEKFQTLRFDTYILGDPMSISGNAVKITYQNGDYEMICYYWAEYVKNGDVYNVRKSCDEREFNKLINEFLD